MKNTILKLILSLIIMGLAVQTIFIVLDFTNQEAAINSFKKGLKQSTWIF